MVQTAYRLRERDYIYCGGNRWLTKNKGDLEYNETNKHRKRKSELPKLIIQRGADTWKVLL